MGQPADIVVVDYGMGNLRSVANAFGKIGHACAVSSEPDRVAAARKLVLPGVGAFGDAMKNLRERGLLEPIQDFLGSGRPFFGICLGLQMLFERSFEDGEHEGLGYFTGDVVRFELPRPFKVPHMGWNHLEIARPAPFLAGLPADAMAYFVHSYHARPKDESIVAARTDYGGPFVSAVCRGHVFAAQFHPEKSQRIGLQMLENFAAA